jgi:hypothetical protein
MEINSDQLMKNALQDGLREGIKSKLSGYNSPIDGLISECIKKHDAEFRELLNE